MFIITFSKKIVTLHRRIYFFYFFPLILLSQEPSIAILSKIYNNSTFLLQKGVKVYTCKVYGVVTLEDLFFRAKADNQCQKEIINLYEKRVNLKYFAFFRLKEEQSYHINDKNGRCIIYSKGETTYSEELLKKGLALIALHFKDEVFDYVFTQAQENAKIEKKGLWGTKIPIVCKSYYYNRL
jgi:hypothetical protein